MGNKKAPKGVASNVSSNANPAASSNTQHGSNSSIIRSSFCPSFFQLSLFASVIQGFDSQHLRIHDTSTGRIRCEHAIGSKAVVTCLDWGYYGENHRDRRHQEANKKRKRSDLVNGAAFNEGAGNVAIAFGTNDSKIEIFSPSEAKLVGTLKDTHTQGIRDFKFVNHGLHAEAWSVGGDGMLVQWDLKKGGALRNVKLPHGPANTLCPLRSSVICAAYNAYILNPDSGEQPPAFTASTNPIHTIVDSIPIVGKGTTFLTSGESDRFMTVFNADLPTSIGSLRTENEVLHLDLYSRHGRLDQKEIGQSLEVRLLQPLEALAAVNRDGILEIFPEPFEFGGSQASDSLKARMKQRTRKASAQVRLLRPDNAVVPLVNASFQGSEIALAWAEGGVNLFFEKVQWRDEGTGNLLLKEMTDIIKAKSGAGVGAVVMNGVKDMGKSYVDESQTVVANGGDADDVSMADEQLEVISISSGVEESESEEEEEEDQGDGAAGLLEAKKAKAEENQNSGEDEDVDMKDMEVDNREEQVEEAEEPSFGDLLRASKSEAVDVQAAFTDPNAQSLVTTGEKGLQQLPSGMSLGTVLTQSLRTNDTNLLETCFHVRDLSIVRATIERLDSPLATVLLQRLAERLHSRPGRAGSLMVWIQWTVVAHGGYLSSQPEVMRKLRSLYRVVDDRAKSLQALLMLKGKLDMLDAQANLRKSMQAQSRARNALEEDDEEGVTYVEGQEESDSEDEEEEEEDTAPDSRPAKAGAEDPELLAAEGSDVSNEDEDDEESENEMPPTINGVIAESADSESDEEGLLDEEASSIDHESRDEDSEDEVDHESIDSVDSSGADTSPPPKHPAKKSKLSNGIGSRKR